MKKTIKLFKVGKYDLWQVGGSVRDSLMNIEPHDIDFTTNATPDQMLAMVPLDPTYTPRHGEEKHRKGDIKTWHSENGIKHGTIVFKEGGENYEVTTFRKDISTDGRNAVVSFAKTIEEDLSRRDFTMNAIAQDAYTGKLFDPFNGIEDIKQKKIRFVGDAKARIQEDFLRLLRGYRFLAQLGKGWTLDLPFDDKTRDALIEKMFKKVSIERIRTELLKIFATNPCFGLYQMPETLRSRLIPTVPNSKHGHYHAEDLSAHVMFALATACRITKDPFFRMGSFLHDIGKREFDIDEKGRRTFKQHEARGAIITKEWMETMRFSNEEIKYVTALVANHMFYYPGDPKGMRRWTKRFVRKVGEEMLLPLLMMRYCDSHANLADIAVSGHIEPTWTEHPIHEEWERIKAEDNCFKVSDLKINGHDVMKEGLTGKPVGETLQVLFERVDEEIIPNERELLLSEMKLLVATRQD